MATAITVSIPKGSRLPDNAAWTNRFELKSASSNRVYTVAQSKSGRFWGCSCPGWKIHKHCKHLNTLGLPGNYQPQEITNG